MHRSSIPNVQAAGDNLPKISHDPPLQTVIATHSKFEKLVSSMDATQRLALEVSTMGRLVLNVRDTFDGMKSLIYRLQPRHIVVRKSVTPKSEALVKKIVDASHEIERMVLDGQN